MRGPGTCLPPIQETSPQPEAAWLDVRDGGGIRVGLRIAERRDAWSVWGNGPSSEITVVGDGPTGMISEHESGRSERGEPAYSGNFAVEEMEKRRCTESLARLDLLRLVLASQHWKRGSRGEKGEGARDDKSLRCESNFPMLLKRC